VNPWPELSPRERQIAELLLQGCGNAEIAKELKLAKRTVKDRFSRMFLRFGITDGMKRVKLATLLYRRKVYGKSDCIRGSEEAESWLPVA
jgi:DNA-binding NarL/FixJ family response regulator